jgi:hypothetical protein
MTTAAISFVISPSDPSAALGAEVWIDQDQIFDTEHLGSPVKISHAVSEDDAEHELRVVLKNKKSEHTAVDADGNITRDAVITVGQFEFEEINIDQIVIDHAVYAHDFNGTRDAVQDRFFGSMGCNGTLSLKFSTPVYIWLLEHM